MVMVLCCACKRRISKDWIRWEYIGGKAWWKLNKVLRPYSYCPKCTQEEIQKLKCQLEGESIGQG
jgi:hypothetical protein